MTQYETLDVRTDDRGIVYLTLNRPDKRNALSPAMMDELTDFVATTGSRTATRAVVLAGAGPAFCAGGDLDWMMAQINADRPTRMSEARRLANMLSALNEMPSPLIGRVHGSALGGGAGLACICDVVIAADSTKFGFTETRLGLIPATIGPYVIARMGEGRARRVFMSARIFDAEEARELGIVSRGVSAADLDAAVEAEIAPYLAAAPGAVGAAKALARALGPKIDSGVTEETIRRLADAWESEEAQEGISAFLNKRPASWE
jgi:methylglutaconyl-CoA hydratase